VSPRAASPLRKQKIADADLHFRMWEAHTFHLVAFVVGVGVLEAVPVLGPAGVAENSMG